MLDEFKKSINNILYERVTSPFYGTFIFSWFIWNWNIVYLTLFVSEKSLSVSKLEYINTHLIDYWKLLFYPFLSSAFLILLVPFIANGAFYINLKFTTWKKNQKQKIEGEVLLSKAESIALRQEILEQENKFVTLLSSKDNEIEQLKALLNEPPHEFETVELEKDELQKIKEKVVQIIGYKKSYDLLLQYIQSGNRVISDNILTTSFVSIFESNGLIKKNGNVYEWTPKGIRFQQLMLDE